MLPAEPSDLEWRTVIVMVGIRPGMSADFAGLPNEITAFESALHGKMSSIFFHVLITPLSLSRIGC